MDINYNLIVDYVNYVPAGSISDITSTDTLNSILPFLVPNRNLSDLKIHIYIYIYFDEYIKYVWTYGLLFGTVGEMSYSCTFTPIWNEIELTMLISQHI